MSMEHVKPNTEEKVCGMIFMCNSKTKIDCYQLKVLGLPASKKDAVSNIYKGMRLFLFDIDLKLMHGIFKAAERGGYNIEPKAFNSAYPSQVRFTVLEECMPLTEEKFRTVIKDNYYTSNKFNCELTSHQVKNMCKLFQASRKDPTMPGRVGRVLRPGGNTTEKSVEQGNFEMPGPFVELARIRFRQWEQKMNRPPETEQQTFASSGLGTSFHTPHPLSPSVYTASDREIYGRNYPSYVGRVDPTTMPLEYMCDPQCPLPETRLLPPTFHHH